MCITTVYEWTPTSTTLPDANIILFVLNITNGKNITLVTLLYWCRYYGDNSLFTMVQEKLYIIHNVRYYLLHFKSV